MDHILKMSVIDTGRGKRRSTIGHASFHLKQLVDENTAGELTHHKMDLEKVRG